MRLIIVIFGFMAAIILGCQDRKFINSRRYAVDVKTWGFGSKSFEAFMYNTDLSTYPPERRGAHWQPNTLYILKHEFFNRKSQTDTLSVILNDSEVDSLYNLAYGYLSNFQIDNKVEIGKIHKSINDGANIKVSLNYDGKLMECSQYRLKGVLHSSSEGEKLIKFINRKSPKKFHLF